MKCIRCDSTLTPDVSSCLRCGAPVGSTKKSHSATSSQGNDSTPAQKADSQSIPTHAAKREPKVAGPEEASKRLSQSGSEQSDVSSSEPLLKFFGIAIIVILVVAVINNTKSTNQGQNSSVTSPKGPTTSSNATQLPTISPKTPPVGKNLVLNASQILWCLREDIFLSEMNKSENLEQVADVFNSNVEFFNARCGNYQYYESDLNQAREIANNQRAELEVAAKELIGAQFSGGYSTELLEQLEVFRKDVQSRLADLLYNPGPIDGVIGKKSRSAISDFQREHNLVVNGLLSVELLTQLEEHLSEVLTQNSRSLYTEAELDRAEELRNISSQQLSEAAQAGDSIAQYLVGDQLYFDENYQEALKWLTPAADTGVVDAINTIGHIHGAGFLPESDPNVAFKLFMEAASRGHLKATNNVGVCYEYGVGVQPNETEALKWYRHAAIRGYAVATTNLARAYLAGTVLGKDTQFGLALLRKALELDSNNIDAATSLGDIYLYGWDVGVDKKKAMHWYELAAHAGDPEANFMMGELTCGQYAKKADCGVGYLWYQAAADRGHPKSMLMLGMLYVAGQGVKQDYAQAYEWFSKSSTKGELFGSYFTAVFLGTGLGIEADEPDALKRFFDIFYNEDADNYLKGLAMFSIGGLYLADDSSLKNTREAAKAFEIAADYENPNAFTNLARLYAEGIVYKRDHKKVIELLIKGADLGDQEAMQFLVEAYETGTFTDQNLAKAEEYRNRLEEVQSRGWMSNLGALVLPTE